MINLKKVSVETEIGTVVVPENLPDVMKSITQNLPNDMIASRAMYTDTLIPVVVAMCTMSDGSRISKSDASKITVSEMQKITSADGSKSRPDVANMTTTQRYAYNRNRRFHEKASGPIRDLFDTGALELVEIDGMEYFVINVDRVQKAYEGSGVAYKDVRI